MNHLFAGSIENPNLCKLCSHNQIDHTSRAICAQCNSETFCNVANGNALLCATCMGELERELLNKNSLENSKKIDASIHVRADLFNAQTLAIIEVKRLIDADDAISLENKHFTLAKHITERHEHIKSVVFGLREDISELQNEQRAIQTYYNDLAKKLRVEEKARIKLSDLNYKPIEPKAIKQPKAPSIKKFDKAEVMRLANEFKLPAQAIQLLCVAKGITPLDAVRILKESGL